MAEYIEREALIAAYDATHKGAAGGARKLMVDAPAADVVEVVRCKDCKHLYFKDMSAYCPFKVSACRPNGFCSYGERSADDATD